MSDDRTFEREKLTFEHNSDQVRHLNAQMNHVPILSITLTGGLWYAAGSMDGVAGDLKFYLLLFASFCNFCLVFVCFRVRDVLESCLERIQQFHPETFADGRPALPILGKFSRSNSMIITYTLLILTAAFLSFVVACIHYWPFSICKWWGVSIPVVFVAIAYGYHQLIRTLQNACRSQISRSVRRYYDKYAADYFEATKSIDMEPLYQRFLNRIPAKGAILDCGSGAGRDTKAFLDKGYNVAAFDISPELAQRSSVYTGVKTKVMSFTDINYVHEFDGIWASASLLHLPPDDLLLALSKLSTALKNDGVMYVSFKEGESQRGTHDGRYFTDMNESRFRATVNKVGTLKILETWTTEGEGVYKGQGRWFNAVLAKH